MGIGPGDGGLPFPTRSGAASTSQICAHEVQADNELEGDSQDLEEQLLHPHKTGRMEEVQTVILQSHQEDEVV